VFQDFDFEQAVRTHKYPTPPENVITWDDDIARSAESGDGYTLVEYLPKMITEACVVSVILDSKSIFFIHIQNYINSLKPTNSFWIMPT